MTEQKTTIRAIVDEDWGAVADLVNRYENDGVTGEILLGRSKRWTDGDPRLQLVIVSPGGEIVGHGRSLRRNSDPAGKFSTIVYVDPEVSGQGLGSSLLTRLEAHAVAHGATHLISYVMETCLRGLAFAARHGYLKNQHLFESKLDLNPFDPRPYFKRKAELEEVGYRFFSLASVGDTECHRRRLHTLDLETDVDTPGFENWGARTFEQYARDEHESFGFTPKGVFVAALGEEWVGLSAVRPKPIQGHMQTDYTGILRGHRGKGLAQVLKALCIDYARTDGATTLYTNNDERNGPMLAVNSKMGFRAEPGFFIVRKELDESNRTDPRGEDHG